jgi:hypothetical protein
MARLALAEEPREEKGDPDLTLEAVSSWTAGQRRCRGPKGARRIDDDLQEELVAADILSRKTIEVPDSEE